MYWDKINTYYLWLVVLLLFTQLSLAQYPNYNINAGRTHASIPFEMHNGFMVIEVKLDRKIPLKFILDSGASNTILIYREFTDLLGVEYERVVQIQGVDRRALIPALVSSPVQLELGEVTAHSQRILVLQNTTVGFGKYAGVRIAGILGMDLFRRFVVRLDYVAQRIHLYEPDDYEWKQKDYTTLDIEVMDSKMYLPLPIQIKKDTSRQARWLVDTGAALSVLIHCSASDSTLIPRDFVLGNVGKGLGGYVMGYKGRTHQFSVGDYTFERFISNFQVLPDSVYAPPPTEPIQGLIGNDVWRQFHVVFQFHDRKIHLKANKHYEPQLSEDVSGISITASGPYLNQYLVEEVYPNSPAARAGVRAGDRILSINRRRCRFMSMEKVEQKLNKKEGKTIQLKILREKEKLKIRMELEAYY